MNALTPCFFPGTGSSDNYAYLVVDDKSKDAVIIDPANPDEYVTLGTYTFAMNLRPD